MPYVYTPLGPFVPQCSGVVRQMPVSRVSQLGAPDSSPLQSKVSHALLAVVCPVPPRAMGRVPDTMALAS